MENFIRFEGVCKYYEMGEQRITAADHIEFSVNRGEFVVIVGPSGAGKTTVLNMLGGMDTCDEGRILLDGEEICRYDRRQLTADRRQDVGFVFQF
ncbi:MAG: ATP-binding cassette domain-containing protein [Clostridia bacterium]|nr:ATP-binding cassette domain-containing protein [Clostridia bacterium]